MKAWFHKITALFMTLVVLLSTMSFTINRHYCGDTLVETALFHQVEGCGMEMDNPATESCAITKKSCCDEDQLTLQGQDELQLTVDKISLEQQVFIASFVYTYNQLFEGVDQNNTSFQDYKPPRVVKQIFKIDETYLI